MLALVEEGDELSRRRTRAAAAGDLRLAGQLDVRIKEVERALVEVKSGAAKRDELAILKSRAGDSERDFDAWLDGLEAAQRWEEFVKAASAEIERFNPALRTASPGTIARLKKIAERHNRALDRVLGGRTRAVPSNRQA